MKRLLIALTAALALSAQAQYINGNKLLDHMNAESAGERVLALGYIAGVVDSYDEELFCVPAKVELSQVRDIAQAFIRRHAKDRHRNASVLVTLALLEAFPCKTGGGV